MGELVGLPAEGPTTTPRVKAFLSITDTTDDGRIGEVVAAVNATVRGWPCSGTAVGADEFTPRVVEGATMLAGRLFRRRESPAGVAAFGEMGPVYVMRNDPDVAMLLNLGSWTRPQIG